MLPIYPNCLKNKSDITSSSLLLFIGYMGIFSVHCDSEDRELFLKVTDKQQDVMNMYDVSEKIN